MMTKEERAAEMEASIELTRSTVIELLERKLRSIKKEQ